MIQDETAALAFSINQSSLYIENRHRPGRGCRHDWLYMGYYRGLRRWDGPELHTTDSRSSVFMAINFWDEHAELNGLPVTGVQDH